MRPVLARIFVLAREVAHACAAGLRGAAEVAARAARAALAGIRAVAIRLGLVVRAVASAAAAGIRRCARAVVAALVLVTPFAARTAVILRAVARALADVARRVARAMAAACTPAGGHPRRETPASGSVASEPLAVAGGVRKGHTPRVGTVVELVRRLSVT